MLPTENDAFYQGGLFQAFFKTCRQSLILKADPPVFTILAVSDNYLRLTFKTRSELLNKGLFEVFPGNDADPSERYSVYSSFKRVMECRANDELPVFKYEIFVPGLGRLDTQFWSNLNEPLFDEAGDVAYLVNTTANITEHVLIKQELTDVRQLREAFSTEQELNQGLLISNENLAWDNAQLGIEQQILQELIGRLTASEARAEQAELTLRLALEAARVGTWRIDCSTRQLHASPRLKELFGFFPEDVMTFKEFVTQITENHRGRMTAAIEQAVTTVGPYDESYPVTGFHDQKTRWLRALGTTSVQKGDFLAFTGVIMDITDQKEDEQRKNDFIGMVSHELKSPLTSLMIYSQMLKARAKKSEDLFAATSLDKMDAQVKKMTAMINGFLDKGQLESGKIHLNFTAFNIEDLINELIDEVRLTVSTHMVNIGQCDAVKVFADRDKMGNVISNLISNAIKYSPEGKYIEVNCAFVNDRVQVSVKDQGIGIKPADTEKLFKRYQRVKTEHTEKIAGFGIGLYLCAEIVRRHKGDIWVKTELGVGSTFYFTLPMMTS